MDENKYSWFLKTETTSSLQLISKQNLHLYYKIVIKSDNFSLVK